MKTQSDERMKEIFGRIRVKCQDDALNVKPILLLVVVCDRKGKTLC